MDAKHHPGMCSCCKPGASPTPVDVMNRPGLSALAYRVGTFSSFRQAMIEALGREPALAGLTTRRSDDSAITVLELWAAVADVLTFYQERIANEAYLRTARERDSVLRLVRLLDYHLRPGLAATTRLAFTVDEGATVRIPVGLRVMSTPGQDERPQIFETVEAFVADARLNRIAVLPVPDAEPPPLSPGNTFVWLLSDTAGLQAAIDLINGDKVLLFDPAASTKAPEEKEIAEIQPDGDRFRLVWTLPVVNNWGASGQAWVFRRKMQMFGHAAPASFATAFSVVANPEFFHWIPNLTPFVFSGNDLPLDGVFKDLAVGDELLVVEPGKLTVRVKVTALNVRDIVLPDTLPGRPSDRTTLKDETSLIDQRHRATVTVATLDRNLSLTDRRDVTVYLLRGPSIPIWNATVGDRITAGPLYVPAIKINEDTFEIGHTLEGTELKPGVRIRLDDIGKGRTILLEDKERRPIAAEIFARPEERNVGGQVFVEIQISTPDNIDLETSSAVLLGNVARATHGETVRDEIVGSGDASIPFQKLALTKPPLTYVPSARTPKGEAALRILVNGELWNEVSSLFGQPPNAPVYTARQSDEGKTLLQFGDGVTGARLPTGRGNVLATYRQGSGLEGRLKPRQLDILLDRPVGLGEVLNPAATEGGADPEDRDRARQSAPVAVRTFGRAVSLLDFEWLALESGQIARAKATWVWRGLEKAVHLTVAGQKGGAFSTDALKTLHSALTRQRDPNHPLLLANVSRVPIEIEAKVTVESRFVREAVAREVRKALREALDFDRMDFAQPLHLSDVYRILQEVRGVLFVDIDIFHFQGRGNWTPANYAARGSDDKPVQEHVRIFPARPRSGTALQDPIVAKLFPQGAPEVLPAEQAFIEVESRDVRLTFLGGLD
ncbi:MAG TPA: baseplate J/gp47 family protein [Thermoanaerobaculia bacterium]|nr:baseplate J/gp47 family protein [Thermoanaerobaculia bacterium]